MNTPLSLLNRIQEQILVVWSYVEAWTLPQVCSTATGAVHAEELPVCQGKDMHRLGNTQWW